MTIVQEVDVVSMLNGSMATINTVNMCVVFVGLAHYSFLINASKQMGLEMTRQVLRREQVHWRSNGRRDCRQVDRKCAYPAVAWQQCVPPAAVSASAKLPVDCLEDTLSIPSRTFPVLLTKTTGEVDLSPRALGKCPQPEHKSSRLPVSAWEQRHRAAPPNNPVHLRRESPFPTNQSINQSIE